MGQQYDRALSLTVGGRQLVNLNGDPDNALRVRFKFSSFTTQAPNHIQVIITNLARQTAINLTKAQGQLELSAGYVSNSGVIFRGDITFAINGRESPTDTTLQLFARDGGNAYDYGVVSKALKKGSTPLDHYNTFLETLKPYGITKGYVPTDILSKLKYPRGVSFFGMVKDHMRTLGQSYGCTWSIQNGALQMVPVNGTVPGAPYVLNSGTGLIGMPTQTPDGIMARCLINPAINLGSGNVVSIDQADIQKAVLNQGYGTAFSGDGAQDATNQLIPEIAQDGLYKILHLEATGDTRGPEWYYDLSCVAKNNKSGVVPKNLLINPNSPTGSS